MKKTLKDYNKVLETASIEERNMVLEQLYAAGIEYYYTDKEKDGLYRIGWNE